GVSLKSRKVRLMRSMSSGESSQFFLPRFLRSGLNHWLAAVSRTLPLAVRGLPIGQHPDIGGDAGVVEEVERQRDNRFEPVVLDQPPPNVAFSLTRIAGEERRAVVHLGTAAAQRRLTVHLRGHVGEEEHLAVAGAGDERQLLALV